MELTHPLDAALRARLRQGTPTTQGDLAKAIGRSPGWLTKYKDGKGNATIDDVIRLVAYLIGVETPQLSEDERRLVRSYRELVALREVDAAEDVLNYAQHRVNLARRAPRGPSKQSSEPEAHTTQATTRKVRGKR